MATRQAYARAITVTPATAARWDDVVGTFGTKGDPSWCWCQYFVTTGSSYEKSAAANKDARHGQVTARPSTTRPAGLLACPGSRPLSRRPEHFRRRRLRGGRTHRHVTPDRAARPDAASGH